jgi:hypothetical protein
VIPVHEADASGNRDSVKCDSEAAGSPLENAQLSCFCLNKAAIFDVANSFMAEKKSDWNEAMEK